MDFENLKSSLIADSHRITRLAPDIVQLRRVFLFICLLILGMVINAGVRSDIDLQIFKASFWIQLFLLTTLTFSSAYFAFKESLPGKTAGNYSPLLLVTTLLLWGGFLYFFEEIKAPTSPQPMECSMAECMVSFIVLLWISIFLSRRTPFFSFRTGLFTGVFCTAVGSLCLHFVCADGSFLHVFFYHMLPSIGIAAVVWSVLTVLGMRR